jgi:cell division protein FtsA
MQETERAIRTAVQGAQKMANVRVDHVIACFSGARPRSYGLAGADRRCTTGTVTGRRRRLGAGGLRRARYGEGREVLHAQPVNFALDHRTGSVDPRGQMGSRLSVDMHMLTIDAVAIQTCCIASSAATSNSRDLASSAYVSGISSLVEDEQELGAACIDMGGGSTVALDLHQEGT